MSFYQNHPRYRPFEAALAPFLQAADLPFADVLLAQDILQAFDDAGVDFGNTSRSVFNPAITLWAFLSQVLSADKSCRAAVLRVSAARQALQLGPCSNDTGAYCRARSRIPVAVLRRLVMQVGRLLDDAIPAEWLWKGRHVYLADGFTASLPDTPDNQQAFPQAKTQKPGLGFPIMRLVVILSLATATVQDLAIGPYKGKKTGEPALLRQMLQSLRPGSVVVADRCFCSYFMIALLRHRGVDVVFRMHHARSVNFRRGQHLGVDDHITTWHRPVRPAWMDQETYDRLPATLSVREVRTSINRPGCRIKELVLATTLVDKESYTRQELTDLYHERWHAELDIRSIKQYLGMDVLRCKTPDMVEKEIWVHVLGYNLVRKVTAQTALAHGSTPRRLSFTAALQTVRAGWDHLTTRSPAERSVMGRGFLRALATETAGDRPNRCEPRAIKRRRKPHKLLMIPRAEAQAALLRL